jgi:glutamine---fructose-6-phosphate transaminase (isomerizing)
VLFGCNPVRRRWFAYERHREDRTGYRLPIVGIVTQGPFYDKTFSNLEEVRARDGKLIVIATEGDSKVATIADDVFIVPANHPLIDPIITVVPLQLLAYHIADIRGTDVDQPRNLAKSVTVE